MISFLWHKLNINTTDCRVYFRQIIWFGARKKIKGEDLQKIFDYLNDTSIDESLSSGESASQFIKRNGKHIYYPLINKQQSTEELIVKNFYITGKFKASIKVLKSLGFINNVFHNASITGGGKLKWHKTNKIVFHKNIFYGSFSFNFSNIKFATFRKNIFKKNAKIKFSLLSFTSPNNIGSGSVHESFEGRTIISFVKNYIKSLFIQDAIKRNLPSLIEHIRFQEGNIIKNLYLDTRYNRFNDDFYYADRKHIYFHMEDMITPDGNVKRKKIISYKGYFLDLQKQFTDKQDIWNERNYQRKIRYYDHRLALRRQDRFIYWWSWLLSNNGISWIQPILWLLGFQYLFISIAECFGGHNFCFWRVYGESLSPISNLSALIYKEANDAPALLSGINIVQKMIWAACVYESVKALRRFSP